MHEVGCDPTHGPAQRAHLPQERWTGFAACDPLDVVRAGGPHPIDERRVGRRRDGDLPPGRGLCGGEVEDGHGHPRARGLGDVEDARRGAGNGVPVIAVAQRCHALM